MKFIKSSHYVEINNNSCIFPKIAVKMAAENFKLMYLSSASRHKNLRTQSSNTNKSMKTIAYFPRWRQKLTPEIWFECILALFSNTKTNEIYICETVCDAVREWSEVTRPSADCQTTIFWRFKQLEIFLKKVAERSRDSGWGHATVGRLSNNVFWTFQAIRNFFEKSRWTVTWQW